MGDVRAVGSYRLHGVVARGATSTVHVAVREGAGAFRRVVAVKRVREELAAEPAVKAALLDEARLSSRLRHARIVSVLDVVEDDGAVHLVMELVRGVSIERLFAAAGEAKVPVGVAVAIACDVLEALECAHAAKDESGAPLALVHRDVSPSNVLVGVDGGAYLVDFGIAWAQMRAQRTATGVRKGKIAYMAPEQLEGAHDAGVDVYAVGAILWELLAGRRLFEAPTTQALVERVLTAQVRRPGKVRGEALPKALENAVSEERRARRVAAVPVRARAASGARGGVPARERRGGRRLGPHAGERRRGAPRRGRRRSGARRRARRRALGGRRRRRRRRGASSSPSPDDEPRHRRRRARRSDRDRGGGRSGDRGARRSNEPRGNPERPRGASEPDRRRTGRPDRGSARDRVGHRTCDADADAVAYFDAATSRDAAGARRGPRRAAPRVRSAGVGGPRRHEALQAGVHLR